MFIEKDTGAAAVSISSVVSYGDVQAHSSTLAMTIKGSLNGALFYPADKFIELTLASRALKGVARVPDRVETRQVQGFACYRFYSASDIPAVGIVGDEVEYWCWEQESGLATPFSVRARLGGQLGYTKVNLDRTFVSQPGNARHRRSRRHQVFVYQQIQRTVIPHFSHGRTQVTASGLQQPFYVHAGQRLPLGSQG